MALKSLTTLDQYKVGGFPAGYPTTTRIFYAPVDDVHGVLTSLINSANKSIHLAMYALEDTGLADLIKAKCNDSKITVQITLDKSQAQVTYEKTLLQNENFPASSIAIGNSEKDAYMHLKAMVIDGKDMAAGSVNWTKSGQLYQDNNLIVIRNSYVAQEAINRLTAIHEFILNKH